MNCCNDFGECKQGPGCPARATAYHQHFDRLGNPVYRAKPGQQHRIIRWASVTTIVVCLGIMVWVR